MCSATKVVLFLGLTGRLGRGKNLKFDTSGGLIQFRFRYAETPALCCQRSLCRPSFQFQFPALQRRTSSLIFPASIRATIFWSAAITEASLQNLGVGSGQLLFGVSQQIGVMKCHAGEAAREECGAK